MEPRIAYTKNCDLYGCQRDCGALPEEKECEFVPVILIPLHEEEACEGNLKARLQFGNEFSTDPWTERTISAPMQRMERMKVTLHTRVE